MSAWLVRKVRVGIFGCRSERCRRKVGTLEHVLAREETAMPGYLT